MGIVRQFANVLLQPIEFAVSKLLRKRPTFPPVYIIGAPRSGSTLLMQVMVQYFRLEYLSNFSHNFYAVPLVGTYLNGWLNRKEAKVGFSSNYGRTHGLSEPSEAADFWYSWFTDRQDVHKSVKAISPIKLEKLFRQLRSMSSIHQMPIAHKNLYNSIRIEPLSKSDPESVFIVITRDMLNTAKSIYTARLKQNPDPNTWWSVPPKIFRDSLGMPLEQQAVDQVFFLYMEIYSQLEKFAPHRYHVIRYEDLCENPNRTMEQLKDWAIERDLELIPRNVEIPALNISEGAVLDQHILSKMDQYLKELVAKEGNPHGV